MDYIASTIERLMKDGSGRKRAYVISTYVIGKERILLQASASSLGFPSFFCMFVHGLQSAVI